MKLPRRQFLHLAVGAAALSTFPRIASAQAYPTRPMTMIVPYAAGGPTDTIARIMAERMRASLGQIVLVENVTGAAGSIGVGRAARAAPDCYTLLSAPPPPLVINRLLYQKLPYDSAQFVPITVIGAIPNVLLVHPKTNVSTVEQLIALAKANPGKLNYASQGSGTTSHLTAELFKSMAGGLNITHVPYKGTAPALADLLGGQVEMMCDNLGVSLPHVRSGKLKALGVASAKRVKALPDVPALAETLPGFEAVAWFGIVAPPKTPRAIAEKVAAGVQDALKMPEVLKRLSELSAEPMGLTPEETAAYMKQETERWAAVIKSAGVKAD